MTSVNSLTREAHSVFPVPLYASLGAAAAFLQLRFRYNSLSQVIKACSPSRRPLSWIFIRGVVYGRHHSHQSWCIGWHSLSSCQRLLCVTLQNRLTPEQNHPKIPGSIFNFPTEKRKNRLYIGDVSPLLIRRLFPAAERHSFSQCSSSYHCCLLSVDVSHS